MRGVYLRNRAGAVAARLENGDAPAVLLEGEPGLVAIEFFDPGTHSPILDSLWEGRSLFEIENVTERGRRLFRAWVPFHFEGEVRIARIDLDANAGDFLLEHARHNVLVAGLSGAALVALSWYAVWSARRAARLQHLANLGTMAAVLAHEIRNPLGTIKGFVQLAAEAGAVRDLLEPALEETGRLERLVSDLLLYARPPAPALRDVLWDDFTRALPRGPQVSIDERPWRIRTDPDLLRQAVLNLIRNATEAVAGQPDGRVRVEAVPRSGGWALTVEDNGPGLPDSVRARLFEPFLTTKAAGTGLGLPITRNLVEALGGRLALRNALPRGTRAEILFPASKLEECNGNRPGSG